MRMIHGDYLLREFNISIRKKGTFRYSNMYFIENSSDMLFVYGNSKRQESANLYTLGHHVKWYIIVGSRNMKENISHELEEKKIDQFKTCF